MHVGWPNLAICTKCEFALIAALANTWHKPVFSFSLRTLDQNMDTAVSLCVSIAVKIHAMAQAAKQNKEQAKMLAGRVDRLTQQLQRMRLNPATHSKCVGELQNTRESALDLITAHDKQSYLFKVLRSGTNTTKFQEIHDRLTRISQDLGIQAVADIGKT